MAATRQRRRMGARMTDKGSDAPVPVALRYKLAKGPNRPIVLLHSWCCDSSVMAAQFSHFVQRDHAVLALDLRGHGHSDKPDLPYTVEAFADDVAMLCAELRLNLPLFVGHSLGGIVAFELALRYPHVPAGLVMMDSAMLLPDTARAELADLILAMRTPHYRAALREYALEKLFLPTDDHTRRERLLNDMIATPQHVIISSLESLAAYQPVKIAANDVAPTLYIGTDEGFSRADMARFEALAPDMLFGKTVGSGHFCHMEVPGQVNAMIDRFMRVMPQGI